MLPRPDAGVALLDGEVVLSDDADPGADPTLPLRVALVAADRHLPVAAVTRVSLARCPAPQGPWSAVPSRLARAPGRAGPDAGAADRASALDLLVELLGTGEELVRLWEDLDLAGLPERWWPGWREVRNRPQHNPLHTYTVDRHMVRTAALAAELLGSQEAAAGLGSLGLPVPGPPERRALLLAALVHDLGKVPGVMGEDHARVGAQRAREVLAVLGPAPAEAEEVELLVRHHLLLPELAGHRPGAPEALAAATQALGAGEPARRRLAALWLLTQADARAAGPRAWTGVRAEVLARATAGLAHGLVLGTPNVRQ
ncbi:MAG: HD domain-containing protein [Actinomyces sp.]|uniref:HD domain-containing protein n=1 Tax=Actinomyces sp. TaxID=29317 RepID=UPI0026DABF95|nr:HD domain-containing protein [Actinomyces sp.]MDO4243145.1 HD domain-containing protein [Actinomyces sp.]